MPFDYRALSLDEISSDLAETLWDLVLNAGERRLEKAAAMLDHAAQFSLHDAKTEHLITCMQRSVEREHVHFDDEQYELLFEAAIQLQTIWALGRLRRLSPRRSAS